MWTRSFDTYDGCNARREFTSRPSSRSVELPLSSLLLRQSQAWFDNLRVRFVRYLYDPTWPWTPSVREFGWWVRPFHRRNL
ncbi:MAG: hypothetical protein LZF60_10030 [Nitrospira sp.]|nr:MAG: hypothetical protein LZF60_10030 [Nitrospira sp.]